MTELANINTDSYENLARAMGMATDKPAKRSNTLNRLRIWHSPVMGQVEVNGKLSNVEIIEGGSYRLELVHEDGSEFIYGRTVNPSLTNCSAAFKVPIGSGNKYFLSGITSNFTKLLFS